MMTSIHSILTLAVAAGSLAGLGGSTPPTRPPSLLVITLDTTRADAIGAYGNHTARTPSLDALASRGLRFSRAISPTPLTLPAHASLLTGLEPPEHGVHDNGIASLPSEIPTLATHLTDRGYTTGAVVASTVLDRRFGLDRGFTTYDDRMAAERTGEYGYPERNARAVTKAALARLEELDGALPGFLWVHYYDPHAPYQGSSTGDSGSVHERYADEIAFVDSQLQQLVSAWTTKFESTVIAVVGDHGESLGEHGEKTHGLLLYRSTLAVPMIITAPGLSPAVIADVVSTRRLAPSLLFLLGIEDYGEFGTPLPGLGIEVEFQPVYSETWMPATAYGWCAVTAITDQRWRFIAAPNEELYDLDSDPAETENLVATKIAVAARSRSLLSSYRDSLISRSADELDLDPELLTDLRSLGYLSGSSARVPRQGTGLDPKEGLALLAELERAESLRQAGDLDTYLSVLESLVARDSGNVPFTSRFAGALFSSGQTQRALDMYRRAIELNPELDFSHLHLAHAYRQLGRHEEARVSYRKVLGLNPRFAAAWLGLAEITRDSGEQNEERRVLEEALATGTTSAGLLLRLAQILLANGEDTRAAISARSATELLPEWDLAWYVLGQIEASRSEVLSARAALTRVTQLSPGTPLAARASSLIGEISSINIDTHN